MARRFEAGVGPEQRDRIYRKDAALKFALVLASLEREVSQRREHYP